MIVVGRIILKLTSKEESLMQLNTQAGGNTINLKVRFFIIIPGISTTKIVT